MLALLEAAPPPAPVEAGSVLDRLAEVLARLDEAARAYEERGAPLASPKRPAVPNPPAA